MKYIFFFCFAIAGPLTQELHAATAFASEGDTTLSVDFQIRTRSEWRDGYRLSTTADAAGTLRTVQRNRIGLSGAWDKLEFKVQLQDVRTFGSPSGQTSANAGAAAAWVAIPLTSKIKATFGRMFVDIDDGRVIGAANWANPGRFLDGVRLDLQRDRGLTSLLATWDEGAQTQRHIAYHMGTLGEGKYRYSLLFFEQISTTQADLTTAGGTWKWMPSKGAWWNAEAYLQFPDGGGTAFMWALNGARNWDNGAGSRWGVDYLSGNDSSPAFNPVLGTNHKFYGWMDHYYVGAATDGLVNAKIDHRIPCFADRATLGATLHHFRSPSDNALLGHELDLWMTGKHASGLQWHVGWSVMDPTVRHIERQGHLAGDIAADAAGILQQWGWVSLNLNPSILLT
jgi:hypothetical protein